LSQFNLSLFDPNTLLPHRAGIAGLALALSELDQSDAPIRWVVSEDTVSLHWDCCDKEAMEWLMQQAYQIQDGLLVSPSLNLSPQGRYTFSQGILSTFLQHNQQRTFDKTPTQISFQVEDNQPEIQIEWRKLLDCYYLRDMKDAFNSKGLFKAEISVKGHHLPGLVECFVNGEYKESPISFIALLFLPLACSYYHLTNGRYALVIPEVNNLHAWVVRRRLLSSRSYRDFRSPGAGEAGLRLLLEEWTAGDLRQHRVEYCEVYQLGKQPWDGNQSGLKQAVYRVNASDTVLAIYQSAVALFPAKVKVNKKDESWLDLSKILPWITDNLVSGKTWYSEFYEFHKANDIYERKGLIKMTEHLHPHEQTLFDAVQGAFRVFRRGQIDQANRQGRPPDWEQITDKVIYRLQRPSTQQEFATALVDFLSQFRSKDLRGVGREIYVWIHGPEWRKARDLTMLAVATYQGKGKEGTPEIVETLPEAEAESESEIYVESL
jgi:CRISPR-associated protein Cas8a1/Csx13